MFGGVMTSLSIRIPQKTCNGVPAAEGGTGRRPGHGDWLYQPGRAGRHLVAAQDRRGRSPSTHRWWCRRPSISQTSRSRAGRWREPIRGGCAARRSWAEKITMKRQRRSGKSASRGSRSDNRPQRPLVISLEGGRRVRFGRPVPRNFRWRFRPLSSCSRCRPNFDVGTLLGVRFPARDLIYTLAELDHDPTLAAAKNRRFERQLNSFQRSDMIISAQLHSRLHATLVVCLCGYHVKTEHRLSRA